MNAMISTSVSPQRFMPGMSNVVNDDPCPYHSACWRAKKTCDIVPSSRTCRSTYTRCAVPCGSVDR